MSNEITSITKAMEVLGITDQLLNEKNNMDIAVQLQEQYGKTSAGMTGGDYDVTCRRDYIYLDAHNNHERKYTWLGFAEACRTVAQEKGALQAAKTASLSALFDIEARIQVHIQAAYTNMLEVGRCLIEAKESGLVPHGEWEDWVRRNAHMSERAAQNLMKAAREVVPGSRLEALPISKIQEILALPESQREAMAERAQTEDMTVKQLREEIARERKRSDQVIEKYNNISNVSRRKDSEIARLNDKVAEAERTYKDWKDVAEREHKREMGALRLQLQEALAAPAGISPEAQAKIDKLTAELEDAEAMIDRQSELRQQAQQALLEMKSQAARGDVAPQEDLTGDVVVAAIGNFIGSMGYLPHSTRLATLRPDDRQRVASHVEMVAKWAEDVLEALKHGDVYVIEEA